MVESGFEAVELAREHLRLGTLIVASPFHRSMIEGIDTVQIIEAIFGNYFDRERHIWP